MRISIDTSPADVGDILLAKYQRTFFDFALAIKEADRSRRWRPEITMEDINQVKRALKELPIKILRPLLEYESLIELSDRKYHLKDEFPGILEDVKEHYHLGDFFKIIEELLDKLKNAKHDMALLGKGRPVSPRTYIIMGWAYLMLEKSKKIDWGLMNSLYEWFWNRLEKHHYYYWMKPPDEAHFHIQYYRYKNRYRPATRVANVSWRALLFGKNFLEEHNTGQRFTTRALDWIERWYGEPGFAREILSIYEREAALNTRAMPYTPPFLVVFPDYSYWITNP